MKKIQIPIQHKDTGTEYQEQRQEKQLFLQLQYIQELQPQQRLRLHPKPQDIRQHLQ